MKMERTDFRVRDSALYFLTISLRTVGCLSVAREVVTLCTVHNMKLAKLMAKVSALNAREFAWHGFARISGFIFERNFRYKAIKSRLTEIEIDVHGVLSREPPFPMSILA